MNDIVLVCIGVLLTLIANAIMWRKGVNFSRLYGKQGEPSKPAAKRKRGKPAGKKKAAKKKGRGPAKPKPEVASNPSPAAISKPGK